MKIDGLFTSAQLSIKKTGNIKSAKHNVQNMTE